MDTILASASRDCQAVRQLEALLRSRPGCGAPALAGLDELVSCCRSPDAVAVVVLTGDYTRALEAIQRLRNVWSGELLAVGPATDPKLILRAVQAGANLFLDESALRLEVDAALTRIQARRGTTGGQVLAVLAAAGGCGASTVAVNLAVVLAKARGRCNLIDLNVGKADLAPLLDLKPQYTLADLCRHEDRLDRTLYEKLLTLHTSGVELLAAPRQFDDLRALSAGGVAGAVDLAREAFADVVVDLEDCFHDEQLAVLERATRVLVVCRLDFTAVRNARYAIDYLTARGVERERIEVVVNHAGLPNELPTAEAEVALGCKLTRLIPHDPETVGWSNNTGIPAAIKNPASGFVQGIARLVGLDTPPPAAPPALVQLRDWLRARGAQLRDAWQSLTNPTPTTQVPPSNAEETLTNYDPLSTTTAADPNARQLTARAG